MVLRMSRAVALASRAASRASRVPAEGVGSDCACRVCVLVQPVLSASAMQVIRKVVFMTPPELELNESER